MVGKVDYTGVPTTTDLENNSNQKKYTVNRYSSRGLEISKSLCVLMAIGALLLAVLVGLLVFFLVPRYCNGDESLPEALTHKPHKSVSNNSKAENKIDDIDERLPSTAPTSTGSNSKAEDDIDERLPRSIESTHYRIQIVPYLQNLTTSGTVAITLNTLEVTRDIIFHVNNISIDKHSVSVTSTKPDSSPIAISDQGNLEGQRYRIVLSEDLEKGEQYLLEIKFKGELNTHLQGFYRSRYTDEQKKERYVASTQFSPTDARRAFPCFDEPSFKAHFTISLARPKNMSTLSNMPLNNTELYVDQNDTYWDHYPETPKMSTYLVAFMVSDLKNSNTSIKIWSRENFLPHTAYASTIAPKILQYFENYFEIKFLLPKIDIVAVPEFGFNAMENWGLITFRESSLLYDPEHSTNDNKRTIAVVLSHEIVHQWFGNLVTPKWWNDLWLKEGFATYLEYFGVNYAEPEWNIVQEFLPSEIQRAMAIDWLESSRPISFEVKNSKQIRQTFDEISYAKGACIIRMMNHFLGEAVFKSGLINFLRKFQGKNADRQDLFTSLTEEAHKAGVLLQNETVKQIMDTWTERPGFPVITATANYEKDKLHISQKRFYLMDKEEKSSWWVPLSFTTYEKDNFSDTRPTFWLKGEYEITEDVRFDRWYLLNIMHTGYFIVNYDEKNWRSLAYHIMDFPPLIRAQLISDSMDLARANLLDYDIPLKMIAKMGRSDNEIMLIPTMVAFKKLRFLSDILSATPAFGHFEEYHKTIFEYAYNRVAFEDNNDHYITQRIRETVLNWSCRSPESPCAHKAKTMFRQLMVERISVPPNVREVVYCTGIRDGSEIEWDFAYNEYLKTNSTSEKNILLDALGCTRLRWLLSRYTDKLIDDSSIRIQDADRVFESVAKNKIGTPIAFDFLRKNWNELLAHYGDGFNIVAKMIKSLGAHMNTEYQLFELERFRDSVKNNLSTTAIAFDTAIETVKANVEWMKKNYHQIEQWLDTYKDQYEYLTTS